MIADDTSSILAAAAVFALAGFSFRCGWMVATWLLTGEWK